ncbi:MAG: hypothetical protein E4H28_08570 [Gemmatimonadales bacterium]|nr:MAG: hypothetical protein E4H28_08570 [Gemmatimonadales bacterium]
MKLRRFRAGDRVLVRSPEEILSTLDTEGTLDGLPFMPEMLDWCCKPFRVERRVEKTCVDLAPPAWGARRRFPKNDVVILDSPRCDGRGHDGCKHGCRIFWKEAWLRPMDAGATTTKGSETRLEELRARLKVKSDESHHFCQSTELSKATEAFAGRRKFWWVRIPFREIRNGDRSVSEVLKLFVLWSWQTLRRAATGEPFLRGPHKRTPSESLGLKPGDVVRVKSLSRIVETLDRNGRNRGMSIWHEATRCCEGVAEVRYRVDRIIDERTGKMRELHDTVTLQNLQKNEALCDECCCQAELGDCPRGELIFWREIWLERAEGSRT